MKYKLRKNPLLTAGITFLFFGLSLGARLWAADVGLILDQTAAYNGSENDSIFERRDNASEYSGALIPWFSAYSENNSDFYFSASIRADWKNEKLYYTPELLRTEFSWHSQSGEFKFGRIQYADPLGFIVNGLFDGAYISMDIGGGNINMGVWYTGLLCKERANITMTPAELESYNTKLDYEHFTDTYFAPRRVVSTLEWEHLGLAEQAQIKLAVLGQFDLAEENNVNSQYFTGRLSVPVNDLVFDLGGCLETIEYEDEYKIALAGEIKFAWMFEITRLTLLGRYSGGVPKNNDSKMTAFLPLTTVEQGDILQTKISGLSIVSLDYLCRLHRTFSIDLAASCFIRNDLGTYNGYPLTTSNDDNYILGTELFGRFYWAPVSDIQINMGGGAFVPAMGNVARDAPFFWRIEMGLILALY